MKRIIAITLLFFSTAAFAQDCDLTGFGQSLTDEQKQSLRVTCEQMVLEQAQAPLAALEQVAAGATNPEAISAWGVVAQEWARALGIAATELGIAVDGFLDTDAGKLTAAIIIWQVMGETILGFVIGIPLLVVIITIGLKTARRAKVKNVEYGEKSGFFGRREVKSIEYFGEDQTVMFWAAHIATIILSIWVIAGVIF